MKKTNRQYCEYLRSTGKQKFEPCRDVWTMLGSWALPHRSYWLQNRRPGERNNNMIVDLTQVLALRSFVAGFLEGNTSATRPWSRIGTGDERIDNDFEAKKWLDSFTRQVHQVLSSSNFYYEAGQFYYDFGVFMTGAHFIEKRKDKLHFQTLIPGSYYVINNRYGEPVVLINEATMSVKAIVDGYAKNGDTSNLSPYVRKMYEDGNYTELIDVCQIVKENDEFEIDKPNAGSNRQWVSYVYEIGANKANTGILVASADSNIEAPAFDNNERYLATEYYRTKPFIIGKSDSSGTFEYGLKGPTLDAYGTIKSLNKKAISKDMALEKMIQPALQGPASLRRPYVTSGSNNFVPLDPTSAAQGGLKPVFEINPAIQYLIQDVTDLRQMIDKIYYADFLLYLSNNPKTRTATETDAIVKEQQLVIGPNLQSLNTTYNVPIVEFVMNFVLYDHPWVSENPIPDILVGRAVRPQFISVFAQAQRAADLPAVDRYMNMVTQVGSIDPRIFDKANLDRLCDIYEDRLFLPAGLNNPQGRVDAMREQAHRDKERQQALTEAIPAMAGAAKDMGIVQQ